MWRRRNFVTGAGAAVASAILLAPAGPCTSAHAAPSVWRDHMTGFAIGGYDPVAYHTEGKPVPGERGIEQRWGGAVWRFANAGNKAAFARHPQIYAPRFAGYDPEALARGLTVEGSPVVWAEYNGRIYLFRNIDALRAWRASPGRLIEEAEARWPALAANLPGTSEW